MSTNNYASAVNAVGVLIVVIAVVHTVIFEVGLLHGYPFDPIIALEISITAVIGIVTSVIARCLKKIEAELLLAS